MAKVLLNLSSKVSKETSKSEILLRFIDGEKLTLRVKSNIFITPKYWSEQKKCIKVSKTIPETAEANNKLSSLCTTIVEEFGVIHNDGATKEWLKTVVDKFHYPEKYIPKEEKKEQTLFEWIEYFISVAPERKDKDTGKLLTRNNIQQYNATYKHLQTLAKLSKKKDYTFSEINLKFYNKFVSYLQGLAFTANSVGKHIRILKLMLNEAPKELTLQADYSKFHVFTEDVDNVYLDKDELQAIKEIDLSETPYLDRVRDWFLLLSWTGCRFSDLEKISRTDIKDGLITFRQQKTNNKVTIPLHPIVVEVLEKYNFDMPEAITNQRFNEWIKIVAKKAGITENETITRTVAGQISTTQHPKYELISSHTGRRSFATNMYKDGLPTLMIMSITGHKTEKSFLKYIKITQKEHAEAMKRRWAEMYNNK